MVVVLGSGLALIAVLIIELSRQARTAGRDLKRAQQQVTAVTGSQIDRQLEDPATVAKFPAANRFSIDERGALSIDAELGRLSPQRAFRPARDSSIIERERLRRARLQEDPVRAQTELAPLLDDPSISAAGRQWFRMELAWLAHREEHFQIRDTELQHVDTAHPAVLASKLLLRLAIEPGRAPDRGELLSVVRRADETTVAALLARLAERGLSTVALDTELARVAQRRRLLRRAQAHVSEFSSATAPVVRTLTSVAGSPLLALFWPATRQGVIVALPTARRVLAELSPATSGQLEFVAASTDDAVPIAAGFAWLRVRTNSSASPLAGPMGSLLLAIALALVCGGGTLFTLRSLRREREALRLRTEFLATVTHELKTPLAGVRLVAELLADGHVDSEADKRTWLKRLEGEAARLGMLIENVLDLGRSQRGEAPHSPERTDLAELVRETLALFEPLAERDGIALRQDLCATLWVDVDRPALQQILLNLCDNARKYGEGPISITLRHEAETAVLRVQDCGPGIQPVDRTRIFEQFRRGSEHEHGSVPGVGLGLHLARSIASRHAGTLELESAQGGACFVLRLPCAQATTEQLESA